MYSEGGYFIVDPEPKFKEVILYRALIKADDSPLNCTPQYISGYLHESKEGALGAKSAIGYIEERVFIKEDGEL